MEANEALANFGNATFMYGTLFGAMLAIVVLSLFDGLKMCCDNKAASKAAPAKAAAPTKKRKK